MSLSTAFNAKSRWAAIWYEIPKKAPDLDKIRQWLKAGVEIDAVNEDGYTLLALAVRHGKWSVAETLIHHGHASAKAGGNLAPLDVLARNDERLKDEVPPGLISALITAGAPLDGEYQGEKFTPLHYFASRGAFIIMTMTRTDVNINLRRGWREETPLITTIRTGHPHCATAILEGKPDLEVRDNNGRTALMWAASTGDIGLVKALIEAGAQVDAQDDAGLTALMWAARENDAEVVTRGGGSDGTRYIARVTPAGILSSPEDRLATLDYLLSKGACLAKTDKTGKKALDWARRKCLLSLMERHNITMEGFEEIHFLVEDYRTYADWLMNMTETPVEWARRNSPIVRALEDAALAPTAKKAPAARLQL